MGINKRFSGFLYQPHPWNNSGIPNPCPRIDKISKKLAPNFPKYRNYWCFQISGEPKKLAPSGHNKILSSFECKGDSEILLYNVYDKYTKTWITKYDFYFTGEGKIYSQGVEVLSEEKIVNYEKIPVYRDICMNEIERFLDSPYPPYLFLGGEWFDLSVNPEVDMDTLREKITAYSCNKKDFITKSLRSGNYIVACSYL